MVAGCRSMRVVNVSVVIPAINEQAVLGRAIASAWQAAAAEVIVADGGSQDDTLRIAAALGVRLLRIAASPASLSAADLPVVAPPSSARRIGGMTKPCPVVLAPGICP